MRAVLAETGLPVAGINTRPGDVAAGELGLAALPGREAEARAAIDEALAYADAIGAAYIQVTGGKVERGTRTQARKTYLKALDYAARGAEPLGITIVIEPLNRATCRAISCNSTDQAAEIIAELGRPNVKILFDCYHAQISEGDLTRRLEKLMPLDRPHPDRRGAVARRAGRGRGRLRPAAADDRCDGLCRLHRRRISPRDGVEDGLGWLRAMRSAAG